MINGDAMGNESIIIGIVTILVILISLLKYKAKLLLRVLVRMILGGISIYFINLILGQNGISTIIAINPLTILTSGLLGFPGVFLLFAVYLLSLV